MSLKKSEDSSGDISESILDRIIEEIAEETVRRNLAVPFIIILELVRPLALLGSVCITMATPFLEFLFPTDKIRNWEHLLGRREKIQALSNAIQERLEKPTNND